jgi:hypothetical protein
MTSLPLLNISFNVVASDDRKWVQTHLSGPKDVFLTPPNSVVFDFVALSKCNHSIISHGTFGLWSAYFKPSGTHIRDYIFWKDAECLDNPTTKWIEMPDPCRYWKNGHWRFVKSGNCTH